ncbi:bifunctional diguanylate cyclase/phosphodiesterase [Arhodomonas aquaeolei]|uniref:putative bifunctional diguanylate cyclase/phosphodiesterase n=1 Tax=Arhodomonas aquaeolei TaxID=2369 RepID=UPI002167F45E|nr:bifunctional diguanylate cyclase/phosphodiesterase [Arhodomonas aquaeolei]MCS4505419.1 bifunctional diguanylate cyclase/phosphodiesterase [Arhodomonas aquaeolei]
MSTDNAGAGESGTMPRQPQPPAGGFTAEDIGRYDHVTRLPSRVQCLERLAADLDAIARGDVPRTLVLVTLAEAQHFNRILRALGHGFSEDFIRAGAERIIECLDAEVTVYNVSVLSFAFVVRDGGTQPPERIARAIAGHFTNAVMVQDIPIQSTVGIGLVPLDAGFTAPAEALRAALTAAQDSRSSHHPFAYYNPGSDAAQRRAFRLLTDLPEALEGDDQFTLHFQPRITFADHLSHSVEALIRWQHPTLGWISPAEFIPLVEATALIRPLTALVLETAIRQLGQWQDTGRELGISVNVSPRNLTEPEFLGRLHGWLERYGVDPRRLELEFTEGAVSPDNTRTMDTLQRVRAMGMTVAIDDFGSGYSNMAYLTRIPADVVKIDKSLVLDLETGEQAHFLVRKINNLAHGLGFSVVAEGIETAKAYDFLDGIGCDQGQGFHMARPMPSEQLDSWLGQ